jgi:methionyl-tRNA formyltransferase
MRSVLLGAVESTATALRILVETGVPPVLVAALPPSHAFRHSDYHDVAHLARQLGCDSQHITRSDDDHFLGILERASADYLFVIGWSRLISSGILTVPRHGTLGFHPAPLPRNRGRAVIPWTILQRERTTGSTLFWIDEGVDSGPVAAQRIFEVASTETAASLYEKHLGALRDMLRELIPRLRTFNAPREAQDETKATWCARRTADDAFINWDHSAEVVSTLVRATGRPYPGAFTIREDRRLVIWDAEVLNEKRYVGIPGQVQELDADGAIILCGDGHCIRVRRVSLEEREMEAGKLLKKHERLGADLARLLYVLPQIRSRN